MNYKTKLIYLENNDLLSGTAQVIDLINEEGKIGIVLDQTLFYPQGGGQPYDQGIIENSNGKFIVEEVRFLDGIVKHFGHFESDNIKPKENVSISIDKERRLLNSRNHSTGHLIDLVLDDLKIKWKAGKGYHFPQGPYVEYIGSTEDIDIDKLKSDLENGCNKIINEGLKVTFKFVSLAEAKELCDFVPDNIPHDKPLRVVMFGNWACACGGTHVKDLKEISDVAIKKIKNKGEGIIRISYLIK